MLTTREYDKLAAVAQGSSVLVYCNYYQILNAY